MACEIEFKEKSVRLNNMQFSGLIEFALHLAQRSADADEQPFVKRMEQMQATELWPGRGLDIGADFPDLAERKFWSRVFLDTARAIFERKVGNHEHDFWQAQAIHQAYAAGLLFQDAVRDVQPQWSAETLDRREFDKVVNRIERSHGPSI